jgi:hypothetical protein
MLQRTKTMRKHPRRCSYFAGATIGLRQKDQVLSGNTLRELSAMKCDPDGLIADNEDHVVSQFSGLRPDSKWFLTPSNTKSLQFEKKKPKSLHFRFAATCY